MIIAGENIHWLIHPCKPNVFSKAKPSGTGGGGGGGGQETVSLQKKTQKNENTK